MSCRRNDKLRDNSDQVNYVHEVLEEDDMIRTRGETKRKLRCTMHRRKQRITTTQLSCSETSTSTLVLHAAHNTVYYIVL